MRLLSYGEDPLTYWSLTKRLGHFLRKLNDTTDPDAALVIYRPSFGREGSSSQFGEFDAIVGTAQGVYLVEAKWSESSELKDGVLSVRDGQLKRHRVFRHYLERWRAALPADWSAFVGAASESFMAQFPGITLPPAGSKLACNLVFVLQLLAPLGRRIEDVLLFNTVREEFAPPRVEPASFRLVVSRVQAVGGAGYFDMTAG